VRLSSLVHRIHYYNYRLRTVTQRVNQLLLRARLDLKRLTDRSHHLFQRLARRLHGHINATCRWHRALGRIGEGDLTTKTVVRQCDDAPKGR
jgi:hypothetical protein